MSIHKVLKRARAIIAEPDNWTQKAYARTASGEELSLEHVNLPTATCFCAIGAVSLACGFGIDDADNQVVTFLNSLAKKRGELGLAEFNDTASHAEVLQLFDRAIKISRK